jgi:hypothetical protein
MDCRMRPQAERRAALEALAQMHGLELSPRVEAQSWEDLAGCAKNRASAASKV